MTGRATCATGQTSAERQVLGLGEPERGIEGGQSLAAQQEASRPIA